MFASDKYFVNYFGYILLVVGLIMECFQKFDLFVTNFALSLHIHLQDDQKVVMIVVYLDIILILSRSKSAAFNHALRI